MKTNSMFLFHFMFQTNALKAISPATLDILLKVLGVGSSPDLQATNLQAEKAANLKTLVLKVIVRMVHIIHESSPDMVSIILHL